MNDVNIYIPQEDLQKIKNKYDKELTKKVNFAVYTFTDMVDREAKGILEDNKYTSYLIKSVNKSVKVYLNKISGEVSVGEEYDKPIYEGENDSNKIKSKPTKLSISADLMKWAAKNNIIQQIRDGWYFIDKNNKEHLVNDINKSALMVYIRTTKFFEDPFNELKNKFIKEMAELVGGNE